MLNRGVLTTFCVVNLFWIIGVSIWASLDSNVIQGFQYLFANRWGIATLSDTYFSFWFIYLWIAYQQKSIAMRVVWFVLISALGTIAISSYGLYRTARSVRLCRENGKSFIENFLL